MEQNDIPLNQAIEKKNNKLSCKNWNEKYLKLSLFNEQEDEQQQQQQAGKKKRKGISIVVIF